MPRPRSLTSLLRQPTGLIQDACCDFETVESVNNDVFNGVHELVETPFFRYYKVHNSSPIVALVDHTHHRPRAQLRAAATTRGAWRPRSQLTKLSAPVSRWIFFANVRFGRRTAAV